MPFDESVRSDTRDHIITSDGVLEEISQADDERNAAHVTIRIPASAAFLDRVRDDHTGLVISIRSKIARSGYELEHNPLDTELGQSELIIRGRVRPLVKDYPTYRHPAGEMFQPGRLFARAFYEDPALRLDADGVREAIKNKRLRIYDSNHHIMPDGTVAIPVDRMRYIWKGPRDDLRGLMDSLLMGAITREGLTAGQLLSPKKVSTLSIRPGDAVITHARFATDFYTVILKDNGHTHFEARLLDPGSGHPAAPTGENNAVKLELANNTQRAIQARHVLMRFYDVPAVG